MKREFLEGLGLDKESVDKIMQENGNDINAEKSKTKSAERERDTARNDLATANATLSTVRGELETLKKSGGNASDIQQKLDVLQAKYDTDTQALQKQIADRDYSDAISRVISNKKLEFSSKGVGRDFIAALKEEKLELKDGELVGVDDFIKAYREADPGAFAPESPPPRFSTAGGSWHGSPSGQPITQAELMAQAIGRANAESGKTANDIISSYLGGNANGT